jgi:hypothetical protein
MGTVEYRVLPRTLEEMETTGFFRVRPKFGGYLSPVLALLTTIPERDDCCSNPTP